MQFHILFLFLFAFLLDKANSNPTDLPPVKNEIEASSSPGTPKTIWRQTSGDYAEIDGIKVDNQGRLVIAGGFDIVYIWDGDTLIDTKFNTSFAGIAWGDIAFDKKNNIYVSGKYHLYRYDGKKWKENYVASAFRSMIMTPDGELLMGGDDVLPNDGSNLNRGLVKWNNPSPSVAFPDRQSSEFLQVFPEYNHESFRDKGVMGLYPYFSVIDGKPGVLFYIDNGNEYELKYMLYEDEIVKPIEIKNGSLPLSDRDVYLAHDEVTGTIYVAGGFDLDGDGLSEDRILKISRLDFRACYLEDEIGPADGSNAVYMGDMKVHPSGDLYVGGKFGSMGNLEVNNIARFDGRNWHRLEDPAEGPWTHVTHIEIDKKGNVYAAGTFWNSETNRNQLIVVQYPANENIGAYLLYDDDSYPQRNPSIPVSFGINSDNSQTSRPFGIRILEGARFRGYSEKYIRGAYYDSYEGLFQDNGSLLQPLSYELDPVPDEKFVKVVYGYSEEMVKPFEAAGLYAGASQKLGLGTFYHRRGLRPFLFFTHQPTMENRSKVRIKSLTIPPGLQAKVTFIEDVPTSGQTETQEITLPIPGELVSEEKTFDIWDITKSLYGRPAKAADIRVDKIEIRPTSYRILDIKFENKETTEIGYAYGGSTTQNNPTDNLISNAKVALAVSTGVSTTHSISNSVSSAVTLGASFSISQSVTLSGQPLGVGASSETSATIEASVTKSVEKSLTTGRDETVSESYELSASCGLVCPPRKICYQTARVKRVKETFDVTTTIILWDEERDAPIGSPIPLTSSIEINLGLTAECLVNEEDFVFTVDNMGDDQKYNTLNTALFPNKGTQICATDSLIEQFQLSTLVVKNPIGYTLSEQYHAALENVKDTDDALLEEFMKLEKLELYYKFIAAEGWTKYATVGNDAGRRFVESKGYTRLTGLGYVHHPPGDGRIALALYWNPNKEEFSIELGESGEYDPNREFVGIQGYIKLTDW